MAALGGRQNPVGYEPDRRTLPNFEQRLYMPHSIAAIVSELAGEGIAPSETLKGTGLLGTQLDNHATRVSYQQIDIVVRNALRLSSQFDLALRAGRRMRVTAYGMYGYALLSSPTLKAARDFAAKYILVVGPFCDGKVNAYDELVEVTIEPLYWLDPMDDLHRFAVEFALAAHLTATRDRIGAQFTFSRIFWTMRRLFASMPTTPSLNVRLCSGKTGAATNICGSMDPRNSAIRALIRWHGKCASNCWQRSAARAASPRISGAS